MARVVRIRVVCQQELGGGGVPVQTPLQNISCPWYGDLVLGVVGLDEELARVDAVGGDEGGVESDAGDDRGV